MDLALNNQQGLICHKTQTNNQSPVRIRKSLLLEGLVEIP